MQVPHFAPPSSRRPAVADSAFASFLYSTYGWMASGLLVSGLTAYAVVAIPSLFALIFGNMGVLLLLFALNIGLAVMLTSKVAQLSPAVAGGTFLAYSMLEGVLLSSVVMAYTQSSITQTFMVTAGSFAGLSAYGALTKRDLTPVGQFMLFGLIGLLLASVVNIFMASSAIQFICSCVGVVVFAGLTAYDNQRLKYMFSVTGGAGNLAINGALMLYLDFVNLFLALLRLTGEQRR